MKQRVLLSLIAFLWLSTTGYAQQPGMKKRKGILKERQEKIFKRKLDFLKKNLILTKEESQKFETLYKDYVQKRMAIKKAYQTDIVEKIKGGKLPELSEAEKQAIIKRKLELDKQLYDLNTGFTKDLTRFLPSEKVIRYFELERRFNRQLMKHLKKRRELQKRKKDMERKRMQMRDQRRLIQSNK